MAPDAVARFVASRFVTLLADHVVMFLVPVVLYLRTRSVAFSGAAFFLEWLPRVVSLPVAGAIVDARPLRRQLTVVDGGRALLAIALLAVGPPVALALLGGVLSVLNGYAMLLGEAVLARSALGPSMAAAQGRMQVAVQLAQVLGPALGAVAFQAWGFGPACVVGGALFAGGAVTTRVLTGALHVDGVARPLNLTAIRRRIASGLSLTFGLAAVRRLAALTFAINLVSGLALAMVPAVVTDVFDEGTGWVGVTMSAASAASLAAAAATTAAARRGRLEDLTRVAGAVMLVAAFAMVGAPTMASFAIAYAAWMAGLTVYVVWMRTRRLTLLPKDCAGAALGVFVAVILAAVPISGLELSLLGDAVGPRSLLLGTVVACLVAAAVFVWRTEPARPVSDKWHA